jgi:hypothetical protein
MDARLALKALSDPQILDQVIELAVARFIADFQRVEEAVHVLADETDGGMERIRSVWPRTTEEVTMLLR